MLILHFLFPLQPLFPIDFHIIPDLVLIYLHLGFKARGYKKGGDEYYDLFYLKELFCRKRNGRRQKRHKRREKIFGLNFLCVFVSV